MQNVVEAVGARLVRAVLGQRGDLLAQTIGSHHGRDFRLQHSALALLSLHAKVNAADLGRGIDALLAIHQQRAKHRAQHNDHCRKLRKH